MDVTHIKGFHQFGFVHVTVDTFSCNVGYLSHRWSSTVENALLFWGFHIRLKQTMLLLTQEKVSISFVLIRIFNTLQGYLTVLKVRPLWNV
jgi:hypothetical protein